MNFQGRAVEKLAYCDSQMLRVSGRESANYSASEQTLNPYLPAILPTRAYGLGETRTLAGSSSALAVASLIPSTIASTSASSLAGGFRAASSSHSTRSGASPASRTIWAWPALVASAFGCVFTYVVTLAVCCLSAFAQIASPRLMSSALVRADSPSPLSARSLSAEVTAPAFVEGPLEPPSLVPHPVAVNIQRRSTARAIKAGSL